jgi:hypothetical protein
MNAWVGIIGTVIGAILGGGLTWLNMRFQLRHQEERERRKFLLGKLEELHEVLSQYRHCYTTATSQHYKASLANESMDLKDSSTVPIEKLRMLIGFYTPELKDSLQGLENAAYEYGNAFVQRLESMKANELERKKALSRVFETQKKIDDICKTLQEEVITISRKYL